MRRRVYRSVVAAEAPTWILAGIIYGGWALLTWHHDALPPALAIALLAWIVAWHGSLQHEAIHDHPGGRRGGTLVGYPPLGLWLPYPIYRVTHLQHHNDARLTDPFDDPESFYKTRGGWLRRPRLGRRLLIVNHTLAGRLILGPALVYATFLAGEANRFRTGARPSRARAWAMHAPAVAAVLCWIVWVAGMPLREYLAAVYAGTSLFLIRSFYEHRAATVPAARTAVVEAAFPFGVLFLFNNLHAAHHAHPRLPWYELPRFYRLNRAALLAQNDGFFFRGYRELFRRFLLRPNYFPIHPSV